MAPTLPVELRARFVARLREDLALFEGFPDGAGPVVATVGLCPRTRRAPDISGQPMILPKNTGGVRD